MSDDEKKRQPLMWRDVLIALVSLGALCAVLSFLVGRSINAPIDFVERYFSFSPDGGNGSLELFLLLMMVTLLATMGFRFAVR